jgi:hypothetical protein
MAAKHLVLCSSILGVLSAAPAARADWGGTLSDSSPTLQAAPDTQPLSLTPAMPAPAAQPAADPKNPAMLDEAPPAPTTPQIHGFFESQFKTAYITPRGLIVQDKGLVVQPVGGIVIDAYDGAGLLNNIAVIGGQWSSIDTAEDNSSVGYYDETDPFGEVDTKWWDSKLEVSVTYVAFISPQDEYKTEHNIETKVGFDDSDYLHAFALHPYMKFFYEVKGDSTVVTGRRGNTYDFEIGGAPSYTLKSFPDYPITISLPTFFTVGPHNFWGGSQNFGTFQTAVSLSMPLTFIPVRFGYWHLDGSFTYVYEINHELRTAADILGNGTDPSRFVGEVGNGMNF